MAEINIEKMAQNVAKKAIQELRDRGVFFSRWIPVREGLPYCNDWYQTTAIVNETQKLVLDLYYKNGKWLDNRRIDMYDTYDIHGYGKTGVFHEMNRDEFDEFDWTDMVIAWMPLPAPFEPQESEDKG